MTTKINVTELSPEAAAEYRNQQPQTDKECIATLARMSRLDYDRRRKSAAEQLGIKVDTLDRVVRDHRAQNEEDNEALPHWKVESLPDPVDGAALLNAIRQIFRRYIILPKDADIALALWVLHTWTMDAGDISPFMVLVSPTKRCGKTSVLILLQYLTPRSELAGNITASALFRYIEAVRPTLLIDEADSFVKDNEELRGILNSGHTKAAANVIRNVEINGEHQPRRFSTWAPKAIATIRSLADTLEDRSIIVQLQRKAPSAKVERLRRRDNKCCVALRNQASRWSKDNFDQLVDPDPQMPQKLNDRAADNWRPLLAIADLAGGEWPQLARQACLTLSGENPEEALGVMLLVDCRGAFGDSAVIRSVDLATALVADPERPWAEHNRGKPISQRQIARLLGAFGIISTTVHPAGLAHGKGYRRVDFEEAWAVYTPSDQKPIRQACERASADETGTTHDFRSVREDISHGSKNGNLSYSHAGLHACTDRNGGNGAEHGSNQEIVPADVPLVPIPKAPLPPGARRVRPNMIPGRPRCDHCGQPGTAADMLQGWDWPGRPDGVRLHKRCEVPWYDNGGRGAAP
jgi:putative DNA primase/helicase